MRVGSEMSCAPLVGFISPPAWYDPSPTEFRAIAVDEVRVQQYVLPLQNFDWRLEEVSETELDQILAAQTLGDVGCDVIATVGTPFAWAGLRTADDARARCARLPAASGVPNVMAGIAILDALNVLGARKVGLACTYYSEYWRDLWRSYVEASGFEVLAAHNLADHGLAPRRAVANHDYELPTPAQTEASIRQMARSLPHVEAIAISGAGARTLCFIRELEDELGIPLVAADTALYWSIGKTLQIRLKAEVLSKLSYI
jgi:maleate cis-trans isomerase